MPSIKRLLTLSSLVIVGLAVLSGAPQGAEAATITVDTTVDELNSNGNCSLREAVQAANTDATVDACSAGSGADSITLPVGTFTLTLGSELSISSDVALNGASAKTTIIEAATSPGSASWRVFNIASGIVSVSDVTVRHGKLADHGAGVLNAGTLTVADTTFSDNDSGTTRHGGAINNKSGAILMVVRSTFSNNSASEGGAIQNRGSATISNSTFSGNSASNSGGGLDNIGSGISTSVNNSTFTGNTGSPTREDCFGAGISSLGHNLVGVGTGCPIGGTGDVASASPLLGPLQDNGGPTFTHALLSGSPAIDAGNPAAPGSGGAACEAIDQRGVTRPQGSGCDIGAFEFQPSAPVPGASSWGLIGMAIAVSGLFVWRSRRDRAVA